MSGIKDAPDIGVLPPVLVGGMLLIGVGIHYLIRQSKSCLAFLRVYLV